MMLQGGYLSSFDEAGFVVVDDVIDSKRCDELGAEVDSVAAEHAGSRNLLSHPSCRSLATMLKQHPQIGHLLPRAAVAVQCTLFNKTEQKNWLVSFHQDLSVPVRTYVDSSHWGGWSQKEGQWFAQPPDELLSNMVAVRLHLDASTFENGPLRIVPGSHQFGRLSTAQAEEQRQRAVEIPLHSPKGGALVIRPLLLHASSKATRPTARRVLHFLFGPALLPNGLDWADSV